MNLTSRQFFSTAKHCKGTVKRLDQLNQQLSEENKNL